MTFGTVEISVLTVLEMLKELEEFPVFLVSPVGIPGEDPADGPDHQAVGDQQEDQAEGKPSDKGRQKTGDEAAGQNDHAETVRTVSAGHKMLYSHTHIHEQISKP